MAYPLPVAPSGTAPVPPLAPAYAFGDALVVDRGAGRGLVLLNHSARFIWERVGQGLDAAAIARDLAEAAAIPGAMANATVQGALETWGRAGLLAAPTPAAPILKDRAGPPDAVGFGAAISGVYRLGPRPVRVSFATPALASEFAARFAYTRDDSAAPAGHLRLGRSGRRYVLAEADRVLEASSQPETVQGVFMKRLLELAHGREDWLAVLHAAALRLPSGQTLAFSGPSGAGKSTLARALGQWGCGYFSDDCVPITRDGTAIPVPFAICLKSPAGPDAAAAGPGLPKGPATHVSRQGLPCRYIVPDHILSDPAPLDGIVFLQRHPQHPTAPARPGLTPVSPAEALEELFARRAWVATDPASLVAFLGLMERTPAWRLAYSSSAEAIGCLEQLGGQLAGRA